MRFHWRHWIEEFGSPSYYSTMHWESKHKQLKLIKENQTNNSNHYKDILFKDMKKSVHCIAHYVPATVEEVCVIVFNYIINFIFRMFVV